MALRLRYKVLLYILLTFVVLFAALVAFVWWNVQSAGGGPPWASASEWAEDHMLRELRSLQPEGGGVRLEAVDRVLLVSRATGPQGYEHWQREKKPLLMPGDAIVYPDHHGSTSYTVRQVLADRVVMYYEASHMMGPNKTHHEATLELAWRTSSPVSTRGQQQAAIARELGARITSLRASADGRAVEVVTGVPTKFSVHRGADSHVFEDRTLQQATLQVGESFVLNDFEGNKYIYADVKEVRPGGVLLDYRAHADWRNPANGRTLERKDVGEIELAWKR